MVGISQMFDDGDFGLCDTFNIQLEQPDATPYANGVCPDKSTCSGETSDDPN